jgi:hypothetical protein
MELIVHSILAFILFIFGVSGMFYYIILKGLVFYRLRKNTNELWLDLGSPKLFSWHENAGVIDYIHNSEELLIKIEDSDPLNIKLINLAVFMHIVSIRLVPIVIAGSVIFYIMRWHFEW